MATQKQGRTGVGMAWQGTQQDRVEKRIESIDNAHACRNTYTANMVARTILPILAWHIHELSMKYTCVRLKVNYK